MPTTARPYATRPDVSDIIRGEERERHQQHRPMVRPPPPGTAGEIRAEPERGFATKAKDFVVHDIYGVPHYGAPRTDWLPFLATNMVPAASAMRGVNRLAKGILRVNRPTWQASDWTKVFRPGYHTKANIESLYESERLWRPRTESPNPPGILRKLGERFTSPRTQKEYDELVDQAIQADDEFYGSLNPRKLEDTYSHLVGDIVERREAVRPMDLVEDLRLRDLDWGVTAMQNYYEGVPMSALAARPFVYNILKGLAQRFPNTIGKHLDEAAAGRGPLGSMNYVNSGVTGSETGAFTKATPPDFQSLIWGLRPFWSSR